MLLVAEGRNLLDPTDSSGGVGPGLVGAVAVGMQDAVHAGGCARHLGVEQSFVIDRRSYRRMPGRCRSALAGI